MEKRIGIIGLGIMGGAFARNLVASGWSVIGYDTEPQRIAEAKAAGVEIAHSAAAVAEAAPDLITSLPTPRAVLDTAAVIAGADAKGRTVIEASTLSLADKEAFREILESAGHTALDCPMSGTGAQAAVKDLVVLASGDSAAILRLQPAFLGFARKVYDLGPYGNGSKMKFIANHLVAIHNVAAAEAMVLARKAGLDAHQTVEVIGSGAGTSRVFELRAPMMADGHYLPATMRSSTWKKDLTVIGEFAAAAGCPTPLFGLAATLHAVTLAMGHGEEDTAVVCAALEAMAGLERK
ncbi:MAG TPA: NAD(P)-dependent oxidoreductase [Hyphomicrobiaceae bacterium]|nr:NAD(P)-dependent oxidoreductase [Hyphomicrobiaceae bacterium]